MQDTANQAAPETTQQAAVAEATQPQPVDVSNVEVPLTLTVAEINYVLNLIGQQPYGTVAGLVEKIKGQAEDYLARTLQQSAA